MAKKLTDDDIRAQIEKNRTEHGCLRNAVGKLGDELGLQFDEKGDVVGRTHKEQPVAQSVPPTPPVLSVNREDLKWAIEEAFKTNPPKVTIQQPQAATSQPSPNSFNNKVIEAIVEKWDPVIGGYCSEIMEAYGAAADAKDEEPIFEERTVRKMLKFHAFGGKCLRWLIQDMLSSLKKAVAYELAFFCALFGGYQYYHNQQLLTQHKKDVIIRYVLSGDPSNKAMIEKIDTLLSERGVDEAYELVLSTKTN